MTKRRQKIAYSGLLAILCTAMIAPLVAAANDAGSGEGSSLRQGLYFLCGLIALIAYRREKTGSLFKMIPYMFVVYLIWAGISILWSLDPGTAARRFALTLLVVVSIFVLISIAGYADSIDAIRKVLIVILVANFASVIFFPGWSIHQTDVIDPSIIGAWHGVLEQKNFAGLVCAMTVIFFITDAKKEKAIVKNTVVFFAILFLYKTESKTSAGMLVLALFSGFAIRRYKPYYAGVMALFAALFISLIVVLGYAYWDLLVAPFQSEDALTGRVQIWPVLIQYWKDHWLLGSGYGSFWNIQGPQPISAYTSSWVGKMMSGHNGYLDQLVQTGLVGIVLLILGVVVAPLISIFSNRNLSDDQRSLVFSVFIFCILHNLTESSLLDRDSIGNVFYVISLALIEAKSENSLARLDNVRLLSAN